MASQQDLQELLRLLTAGRKQPMMQAMAQIKALQAVGLRSIKEIAEAPYAAVQSAVMDDKQAKSLHSACRAALTRPASGDKRGAPSSSAAETDSNSKRAKYSDPDGLMAGPVEMTAEELERSLDLPVATDEDRISKTVLQANRAPLVLAFAAELLRYTMPEQPPSSRLSLAQAVVSANSRSKAVSLGLEAGPSADDDGWGQGQPRVRTLGRDVAVLKRGGYEWKGEETVGCGEPASQERPDTAGGATPETQARLSSATTSLPPFEPTSTGTWSASQPVSLKKSTFVARATHITDAGQRHLLMRSLLDANPNLKAATHNAWAYRVALRGAGGAAGRVREESSDDGETGCGDLMLRIMRQVDAVDTLVVLTRWFGGVMLGPDRWRLMRNCVTGALAERLRKTGADATLGGEAVWGLDLEGMRSQSTAGAAGSGKPQHNISGVVGVQIHRPEAARSYLLKSFASATGPAGAPDEPHTESQGVDATGKGTKNRRAGKGRKKTLKERDSEKEENLALLLGALRLLFDSWADHLSSADLDRRAWSWYAAARPAVDSGPSGWGAKGVIKLEDILKLRRGERHA